LQLLRALPGARFNVQPAFQYVIGSLLKWGQVSLYWVRVMKKYGYPAVASGGKAAHPGIERILCRMLILVVLAASVSACNMHPISRSLTRYGYMDTTGRVVIQTQYKDARHFSEGFAAMEVDGKWGYVDRNGQVVIRPQFHKAKAFRNDRALVEVSPDSWRYIDRTGKVAIDIDFKLSIYARDFSGGLAAIYIEDRERFECLSGVNQDVREKYNNSNPYISRQFCGRWGFIDTAGTFAVEPHFIEAFSFSDGLAAVRVRDPNVQDQRRWLYGFIDRTGTIVIAPQFEAAFDFSEDIARVIVDGRNGFIDKTGKRLTEATFDDAKDFHEGLAQVKVGDRWGYLDTAGKIAIPAEFTLAGRFSEGLAAARRSGKLGGYIDRTGTMVIREQFGLAWPFSDGLARVKIGEGSGLFDNWGYIDKSGKVIISRALKQGWPFSEGLALIGNGGPI
jgi:hypothetical protein